MIPGMNLLAAALTVIAPQQIVLYRATGRVENAVGQWVTSYAPGVPVEGSWQAVDRSKYEQLGLDLSKQYFNFYTRDKITAIQPDVSPDLAMRDGRKYSAVGETPWNNVDGWQGTVFVDIGAAD